MFDWFKKKRIASGAPITTDIHSHLLPGLDDGVKSLEEAEEIILEFQRLGYTKLITTPHVIHDSFRNTTAGILTKLEELKKHLQSKGIPIEIEAAAEYYLDENLMQQVNAGEPLLTFGNSLLLFETNFLSEPLNLKEFIFRVTAKGYKPVLAHPERYVYLQNNFDKIQDLMDRGVLLQINLASLAAYYSRPVQLMAQRLIDKGWVHLLGSDCHHFQHAKLIAKIKSSTHLQKALTLPLLNNSL